MAGETIISFVYGLEVQDEDDPYITAVRRALVGLVVAAVPGAFLVDALPILKYVPDWMPFAGFKRKVKQWCHWATIMVNMPFEAAQRDIRNGDAQPSFVLNSLDSMDRSKDIEHQQSVIKSTAATMYLAGSDTTSTAISSCVLGLVSQPKVFNKAREEIDRVIGTGNLPTFEDRDSLPYITAIAKEALRWRDVLPIDENICAILQKSSTNDYFQDGKIDPDAKDPASIAFGFGRRICPGQYMAFSAIWIAIASMIATLDISKAVDDNGKIIEPSYEYVSALVRYATYPRAPGFSFLMKNYITVPSSPLPFKCSIKPRSPQAESLIRATTNAEYF
ncbi:hypothetical protein H0H81_002981 [Sphagnurus paluster]|uniref:Cytochrome P450 n=1 Tax=Sphagnurus paluster TaxID=117069 RepID=A0A9P7K680_9AGAR|nr:hypothetical protein H0H81_002981 [Sphagnurus paluster]